VIEAGDVVVVTQKIVSKAEGRLVSLQDVEPSSESMRFAAEARKDPALVELALREATRVVRMEKGVLVTETAHGLVCANSGVDSSNVKAGYATLLPEDPDASARRLRDALVAASASQWPSSCPIRSDGRGAWARRTSRSAWPACGRSPICAAPSTRTGIGSRPR
jgi:coenzyme F420-0:L-glutamate ligase/coenzyme F420-1:gamma-L-glutamate ligase